MLQETHFPRWYIPSFLHAQFPKFYLANAEDKSKGVAILFAKKCKFSVQQEYRDPDGRYILIKGFIEDHLFSFVSYYIPNKGQVKFFQTMFQVLGPKIEWTVIFGGDSNTAFDQSMDKSKPPASQLTHPTRNSSSIAKPIRISRYMAGT